MIKEVSVILPVYNGERFILRALSILNNYFSKNDFKYEIIFSVQKSTDKTLEVVKSIKDKNVKYTYSKKKGKWRGIKAGLEKAKYSHVFFLDVDMSYPISLLDDAKDKSDDVIIGSRYMKSSSHSNFSVVRRVVSFFYKALVRVLFGINTSDVQVGCKIIKKDVFKKIVPDDNYWIGDTELLYYAKKKSFSILEIPINYDYQENTLGVFRTSLNMFFAILRLRFKLFFK
ncbi:MAG: glycosyltransferase family 2 protein [Candidatus Woesearchaeota archaeon]